MSDTEKTVSVGELLLGKPVEWAKADAHFDIMKHVQGSGAKVIFEDTHVIAFEEDDDEREVRASPGERRISIAPKKTLASFMDVNVADSQLTAHLLHAIQQVSFKLGLQKTGFEIRFNVLPPYQRRPHFVMKIRTGDPKKATASGGDDLG